MLSYIRPRAGRSSSISAYTSPDQKYESILHRQDKSLRRSNTTSNPSYVTSIPKKSKDNLSKTCANDSISQPLEVEKNILHETNTYNDNITYPEFYSNEKHPCSTDNPENQNSEQYYDVQHEYSPPFEPEKTNCPSRANTQVRSDGNSKRPSIRLSKSKFNLLNPIILLARRRSSRAAAQFPQELLKSQSSENNFPDETGRKFDPSIRGTFVHDFNVPRKFRGHYNVQKIGSLDEISSSPCYSQSSPDSMVTDESLETPWSDRNQTPVFTQKMDGQYMTQDLNEKSISLKDLALPNTQDFATVKPHILQTCIGFNEITTAEKNRGVKVDLNSLNHNDFFLEEPPLPRKVSRVMIEPLKLSKGVDLTTMTTSGMSENSQESYLAPKDMSRATSQRFSFDMTDIIGQEKVMEERYREKLIEMRYEVENIHSSRIVQGYNYNDESSDNNRYEDGISETIVEPKLKKNIRGLKIFNLSQDDLKNEKPQCEIARWVKPSLGSIRYGRAIRNNRKPELKTLNTMLDYDNQNFIPEKDINQEMEQESQYFASCHQSLDLSEQVSYTSISPSPTYDDFYFDDGNITAPSEIPSSHTFDETIFDNFEVDQYGQSFTKLSPMKFVSPLTIQSDSSASRETFTSAKEFNSMYVPESLVPLENYEDFTLQTSMVELSKSGNLLKQQSNALTEESLAAFQNALAAASFISAANGRSNQDSTISESSISTQEAPQPDVTTDSYQNSSYDPVSVFDEQDDCFELEDILQDCDMIAAANADALANDYEGFYGQEFGFYHIPDTLRNDMVSENGGYFGPIGLEGIHRNQAGRFGLREPNLTPITERSEYSNCNSYMY